MVHYNFYREKINYDSERDIAPKLERIGEKDVFNDFTAASDREDAVHLIHKLKCREIVETKMARYWAERVER